MGCGSCRVEFIRQFSEYSHSGHYNGMYTNYLLVTLEQQRDVLIDRALSGNYGEERMRHNSHEKYIT